MNPRSDAMRPVHALGHTLSRLETCEGAGDPRRGPLRQRAWNLAKVLPPGSLTELVARQFQERFRTLVGTEFPMPIRATRTPEPVVGGSYWLSSHDELGAVIRVRLEMRAEGDRPFATFWPAAQIDETARQAARDAYRAASRALPSPPLAPLFGWHRVSSLDPGLPSLPSVEGSSMGAALSLMLLSSWSGHPLPQDRAVTGKIDERGRLVLPGNGPRSVAAKLEAIRRERPCVRTLYVPPGLSPREETRESGIEVIEIEDLFALRTCFGLAEVSPPRPTTVGIWLEAAQEAAWLDRSRSVPVSILRDRLESLVLGYEHLLIAAGFGESPPWALFQAHAETQMLLCRYRAYEGDREGAMEVATELQWLLDGGGDAPRPQHAVKARLKNGLASLLIELGRSDEAHRYADAALQDARIAEDRLEAARILSTHGRIAAHAGDDETALSHLDAARLGFEAVAPWEANICRCYTIAALGRLGRFDEAWSQLGEAEAANASAAGMSQGWQESNGLYLAHERLRLALLSHRDLEAAVSEVSARLAGGPPGPWPAAVVLSRLVEAALRQGEADRVEERLGELRRLQQSHPVAIVALHRYRAAAAVLQHRLQASLPVSGVLETEAGLWLKDRILRGPPGREPRATAVLEGRPLTTADRAAGLASLLATDVY